MQLTFGAGRSGRVAAIVTSSGRVGISWGTTGDYLRSLTADCHYETEMGESWEQWENWRHHFESSASHDGFLRVKGRRKKNKLDIAKESRMSS